MIREIYGPIQKSTKYRMIFVFYEENDIFEILFTLVSSSFDANEHLLETLCYLIYQVH